MEKTSGRALRRFRDHVAIKRQVKIAKQHNTGLPANEQHRVAKLHAMDCGRPGCGCSNDRRNPLVKGMERLTVQERLHVKRLSVETAEYLAYGNHEDLAYEPAANDALASLLERQAA